MSFFTRSLSPKPEPKPRPIITPRDRSTEDDLSEADLRRLFRAAQAERPEWYRAVRQLLHAVLAESLYDVTDASLNGRQLRHAAGGAANLAEVLARMDAYATAQENETEAANEE